jgi:hypothetical protein
MNYGDTVFVVTTANVVKATIRGIVSCKGVVTGYEVTYVPSDEYPSPQQSKVLRKNVYTNEEAAVKALFIQNLKKEEEVKTPSADVRGDRHWIPGYKKRKW